MKIRTLVFMLALAVPAISQAQVFKCVDGQGKITFSQTPCAGQASESVDVKIDKSRPPEPKSAAQLEVDRRFRESRERIRSASQSRPAAARQVERTACKQLSDQEVRTMIIRHQVVPGMKMSDVFRSWGKPESINGRQHVWWFGTLKGSYVYEKDGCVESVSGPGYRGSKFIR